MHFYFIIQSGPLEGTRYKVSSGLTLGRSSSANISIKDLNMSSVHAQVQKKDNQLYLVDKGSKNKIRINNTKKESLLLKNGLLFQLGSTKIKVGEGETVAQENTKMGGTSAGSADSITSAASEKKDWNQLLYDKLSQKKFINPPPVENITAFTSIVELTFITGLQRKTKWLLGYGPRNIGPSSYDLPIIGSNVPDICFSIVAKNNAPVFQTQHTDKVLLNKKSISSVAVKSGDMVYINDIEIKINLL